MFFAEIKVSQLMGFSRAPLANPQIGRMGAIYGEISEVRTRCGYVQQIDRLFGFYDRRQLMGTQVEGQHLRVLATLVQVSDIQVVLLSLRDLKFESVGWHTQGSFRRAGCHI